MSKQRLQVTADVSTIKCQLGKDATCSQVIRLYSVYQIAQGKKAEEVEAFCQISHKSVCNWVHRYNAEGLSGLIDRPRKGRPSRLSAARQEMVKQAVLNTPEQYGYHSATWTGAMVLSYIENTFGISYEKAQIYNLLHTLGLSFQRGRACYPEAGEPEEQVMAIKKNLSELPQGSVVVFEDEASLANTATVSYRWSIKGEQPKICQPQRGKERKTVFGCVCPWEGCLIEQVREKGNTRTFFSFLLKVVRAYEGKKVYMPLDNVKFHHAKRLQPILKRFEYRIELLFLPAYSPDLNPMERVWWLMRKQITHNRWLKTMEQRVEEFEKWCGKTQPEQIKRICNLIENIY